MLDYKLLEALAAVIQEGGFERASKKLAMSQSAVSQRIKLLEEQIGHIVIARTNPPRATKNGRRLLKHFLQTKRLEEDMFSEIIPGNSEEFTTLSIGTNRDCLATWLPQAVQAFLQQEKVVLEFCASDQEQTHQLMKDGDVMGCISVKDQPMQGCKVEYLGRMRYWLVATPHFQAGWFKKGVTEKSVSRAPLICFDRKDEMHDQLFEMVFGKVPGPLRVHYVPSTKAYADFIFRSLAFGLLPEQECGSQIKSGDLVNLMPDTPKEVDLYWHYWNLKSALLHRFSRHLVKEAGSLLERA